MIVASFDLTQPIALKRERLNLPENPRPDTLRRPAIEVLVNRVPVSELLRHVPSRYRALNQ